MTNVTETYAYNCEVSNLNLNDGIQPINLTHHSNLSQFFCDKNRGQENRAKS
jgi:hypothetical protein